MTKKTNDEQQNDGDSADVVTFDDQVAYFAEEFVLDAHDIKEAYKEKPESLKSYFNAEAKTRGDGGMAGFLGAGCLMFCIFTPWTLIVTIPTSVALLIAQFREDSGKEKTIVDAVRHDTEAYRGAGSRTPKAPAVQPG
jgi:hypothetical protein